MNPRSQAALTVAQVMSQQASLDSAFARFGAEFSGKDRALYKALCYGTLRHFFSLEYQIDLHLSKPLKAKDKDIKALLMLGLYQQLHMHTPDHAAIHATVSATQGLKKPWAKGLVNAVLRNCGRQLQTTPTATLATQGPPSVAYEHPPWLLQRLQQAWPQHWQAVVNANNQHAPLTLRVNTRQHNVAQFRQSLNHAGIAHQACAYATEGLQLQAAMDVQQLPGFDQGTCSVQDEAAQLAAGLLDLTPGIRVLDACCAPGGKTCHIAERAPDLKALVAIDSDGARLQKVQENLSRLHLDADIVQAAAQATERWWDGQLFDRILLDAPCSATGVIRRHPDIKLLRRPGDIPTLTALQLRLLNALWQTLRPGGLLLYATCSLLPEENEHVIHRFIHSQSDAVHAPITAPWGLARPYGRQLFPQDQGHDGFFYCRLIKSADTA